MATTSNTPNPIWPPFNFLKASVAILKVLAALSMAVMVIDAPVAVLVNSQHPPQSVEFHTRPGAPPIKGKVGRSPNVGNWVTRPFAPFEHATLLSEPLGLSYVSSNVACTVDARVLCSACGKAWEMCVAKRSVRAKIKEKLKIIAKEDCGSHWVVPVADASELPEKKHARFYMQKVRQYTVTASGKSEIFLSYYLP